MLYTAFKNLPSGSRTDKDFILWLINLSSAGKGLISVRRGKAHTSAKKHIFLLEIKKRKLADTIVFVAFDNVTYDIMK